MQYDARQRADGTWEVIDVETGNVASLGGVRLAQLELIEAAAALHMLRSRFVREARRKQAGGVGKNQWEGR
ncbi:hypothetical protein [Chelativorans sp.]|uniref:hypothetical protein n=1 Tax=Chelativorans sp. TaxID=2203393 RepID=UPI002810E439|nr:hypothetical protein [Chelativorans sp.]